MLYPTLWRTSAAPSIWDELSSARREVDRVFDRFFHQPAGTQVLWMPAVDVRETNDEVHVTAELPGMKSGRFERSFTLPRTVNADHIKARFEDGVLTIRLPKAENAKPRRVQIEANGKQ